MGQRTVLLGVGNTIAIAATAAETGGAFTLLDYELAPGFAGLPPHTHQREDSAIYVLEGRLLVRAGRTERLVGQGECIFLPRGASQGQRNPGAHPVRFLLILLPGGFERCLPELEALLEASATLWPEAIGPLLASYGVQVEQSADQE